MRVPHTVPPNTLKAYDPSTPTLWLVGERTRRLRAENWTWDDAIPPSLAEECIRFFVCNFDEHKRVISLLEEEDLIIFLETLSTELPLEIVIPLIQDGIYWQRRCLDTWSTMNDVTRYGDSWKRMFTERYIRDMIESEEPGYTDWIEMGNTLKLCSPFVIRLEISQLQPPRVLEAAPVAPDLCNTEDFIPEHLDLGPVLSILENLQELNLQFGVKDVGMKFTFKCFRIHPKDIERLSNGLMHSKNLEILRISCSDIDDDKLITILKSLEHCKNFQELEIAHCKITDLGSKALGHFMTIKHSLKNLKLQNNSITAEGAQGLAFALTLKDSAPLETLDLKFNLIGEEGGRYIAAALSKSMHPQHMIIAGCGLGEEAGNDIVDMLSYNTTLVTLDLTNNNLGPEVGMRMAEVLQGNRNILKIDVRNCRFTEECEETIHRLTFRNRERVRKKISRKSEERTATLITTSLRKDSKAVISRGVNDLALFQECPEGVVCEDAFKDIYAKFFPHGNATMYAHFVFKAFDVNCNGAISFRDLLVTLSTLLRGSIYEKLRWTFKLYDINGDGCITRSELGEIVLAIHDMMGRRSHQVEEDRKAREQVDFVFRKLDINQDGVITLEEFIESCLKDDVITRSLRVFDSGL